MLKTDHGLKSRHWKPLQQFAGSWGSLFVSTAHHRVYWFVQLFALVTEAPRTWHVLVNHQEMPIAKCGIASQRLAKGNGWLGKSLGRVTPNCPTVPNSVHDGIRPMANSTKAALRRAREPRDVGKAFQSWIIWTGGRTNITSGGSYHHCNGQKKYSLCRWCAAAF